MVDYDWDFTDAFSDDTYVTGLLLVACMILLCLTAFYLFRRYCFEFFFLTHWMLFLACVILALLHGAGLTAAGAALWGLDVLWRYLYLSQYFPRTITISRLPCDVVRLQFPKPPNWNYQAGQYLFICIPAISCYQWHPFSISSSPHQDEVLIHIRVLGNWTKALHKYASKSAAAMDQVITTAYIEGPYGHPMVDIEGPRYKCMLMISGGIGITPLQVRAYTHEYIFVYFTSSCCNTHTF
jgi:NADPH oxidase